MADYRDLVVRQSLRPSRPQHYGGASSPDLVVAGTEPVEDPDVYATAASYAGDPSVALAAGRPNYVYPRTRMPTGVGLDGQGRLYLGAAPPTAMLWPDRLAMLSTADGDPYTDVDVAADTVGVAGVPFVAAVDPGSTLGGYVFTVAHPVKPRRLGSLGELEAWLFATPGFAQRCVGGIGAGATVRDPCTYEHRGAEPVEVLFRLEWTDCPAGWTVGLEGAHGIELPMTPASGSMGIAKQLTLSGDFVADLTWRLEGGELSPTTDFRLTVFLVEGDGSTYVPMGGRVLRPRPTDATRRNP